MKVISSRDIKILIKKKGEVGSKDKFTKELVTMIITYRKKSVWGGGGVMKELVTMIIKYRKKGRGRGGGEGQRPR